MSLKRIILYLLCCIFITTSVFAQIVTVLSVDGGGIRGVIPAVVLKHLEDRLNKPLSECFDLMVGTSTGGIIVLCLNVPDEHKKPRYSAKELLQIYKNFGQTVFAQSMWQKMRTFNGWTGPKYDHENLEKLLKSYLGDTKFKDALTEMVIPTFDIGEGNTEFFTTNQARKKESRNFYMRDLARATSAAPTYFAPYRLQEIAEGQKKDRTLIDGGITVNNPSVASYIYANNHYKDDTEFFFVSIGTGDTRPSDKRDVVPYDAVKDAGKIGWVKYILNIVMDGVKNLSDGQMQFMFPNHNKKNGCELDDHYVRLQIPIRPEHEDMDNASPENIAQLEQYGQQLIEQSKEKIDLIIQVLNKRNQKKAFLPDKTHIDIKRTG